MGKLERLAGRYSQDDMAIMLVLSATVTKPILLAIERARIRCKDPMSMVLLPFAIDLLLTLPATERDCMGQWRLSF